MFKKKKKLDVFADSKEVIRKVCLHLFIKELVFKIKKIILSRITNNY